MVRQDLADIPEYSLPANYRVRWYECGDEDIWQSIQTRADRYNKITPDLFRSAFGDDPQLLTERQCYIVDPSGAEVGTGTAWFNPNVFGESHGRVHWVAIVPENQGIGLAKPLMSILCHRLKEVGHKQAYLSTLNKRIRAIALYAMFGFCPVIANDKDLDVWREVESQLDFDLEFKD